MHAARQRGDGQTGRFALVATDVNSNVTNKKRSKSVTPLFM